MNKPSQQPVQQQQQQTVTKPIPLHKSISNSSVPSYLTNTHLHLHHHHHHHPQQIYLPAAATQFQPSSAPVHAPAFIYPAFTASHDMQMIPKSNIPICYKYSLNKSSSNSSMGPATIGFYSLNEKPAFTASGIPVLWPQPTSHHQHHHQQAPHHINKSSSSSCIYAKTLNQSAHLSKNNGIFARYKPILSDDDDNDSDMSDDDISKHSNASYVNNVPAPPPFNNRKYSIPTIGNGANFTPFTKISTIQIPVNGQLPPPFKSKNAAMAMERQEEQQKSLDNKKQSLAEGNDTKAQKQNSSVQIAQNTNNNNNNIFFNLMTNNPLTETQNTATIAQHQQQNLQLQQDGHPHATAAAFGVGVISGEQIYTPYTKYLSDRKYFADLNVCGESKLHTATPAVVNEQQQRRNSGTSTCMNKSKIPMYNENKSKQQQQQQIIKEHQHHAQPPPPSSTVINAQPTQLSNTNNNNTNEIDILSAFDPFYVQSTESQQNISSPTTNKLHKLLTSVAKEQQWSDYKNCDAYGSDLLFCGTETAETRHCHSDDDKKKELEILLMSNGLLIDLLSISLF
ncbi:hypothetical protein PVAND_002866 [Polypedilum vanderplanki]|nr:hypothetical protein PVAND_002866 [Polypedilum vanderplanki]